LPDLSSAANLFYDFLMLAFVLLLTAVFLAAVAAFGLAGENFLNIPSISIFLRSFWFSPFLLLEL
jgi:hypothetical protein